MNKQNCALTLVDEIILYYDARSKKHQITAQSVQTLSNKQRHIVQYTDRRHNSVKLKEDRLLYAHVAVEARSVSAGLVESRLPAFKVLRGCSRP